MKNEKLLWLMRQLNMTLSQLATHTGIKRRTLLSYLYIQKSPSLDSLIRLDNLCRRKKVKTDLISIFKK